MILLELVHQVGLQPKKVAETNGGEYHSACPICGGVDRFYIQPNRRMKNCSGYYSCRQCGIQGDAIEFGRSILGLSFREAVDQVQATISSIPFFRLLPRKKRSFSPVRLNLPVIEWMDTAGKIVEKARQEILCQPQVLEYLKRRGICLEAVKRYKVGWISKDTWPRGKSWGLDKEKLWLPKGILIPSIQSDGKVLRLKVRRSDWLEGDKWGKYIAISGSMNGLTIVGDLNHEVVIVVESELDAFAVHHAVKDFARVVAVGSNIKNPDNVTDRIAQNSQHLLICYDNDDAGKKMFDKWKSLYPHSQSYPSSIGKDIGEAVKQGLDIRTWILKGIK